MSITISTGTSVSIAKTYGPSVSMTAITNSADLTTPAVATLAVGHLVVVGDYLEVTSGWDLLDKRLVRVSVVATNSITFENIVTNNASGKYPAGAGIGSIRRVLTWTQLTQLKDMSASGGEQAFADVTGIADRTTKQIPTTRGAVNMTLTAFDDPTLAWYADVTVASDASTPYGLLMSFPNGSKLAANSYWSIQAVPMISKNEALTTQISLAYAAAPVRYST